MKTKTAILTGLVAAGMLLFAGCHGDVFVEEDVAVGSYYGDENVWVREHPPMDRAEYISECPGPDFVWIGGYWFWDSHWVWRSGYWGHRPYRGSIWIRPFWSHEHEGWKYHHGGWRH